MLHFSAFSAPFFFVLGLANLHFTPFSLSSLVANSLFLTPNFALLAPKTPLFNGYFALFGHVFMALKGFVYTIAAYIYA